MPKNLPTMHTTEPRQIHLSTFLSAIVCSGILLTSSSAALGGEPTHGPDFSSQLINRLRNPILPPERPACPALMMEGVAKSRGFTGKLLIAADPQARLTTIQVTDAGPANFAIGVSDVNVWTRDSSGVVNNADFDSYRAGLVSEAYWASGGLMNACWPAKVSFLKADKIGGVSADVLEVVPQGGTATQVWISRKTQLPLRWSRGDAPKLVTTSYANYGKGRKLGIPLQQSIVDLSGNRWDLTINKVQTNADPASVAAKVQKPGQDLADRWIEGGNSTTVAMRLSGQPHVDVMINGKGPFNFLLDTNGALTLTTATAKAAGLKLVGKAGVKGATGLAAPKKFALIDNLGVGAAHLRNQYTTVVDPAPAGLDSQTAGVIGYEVLARFTTTFDFPKQLLTLSLAPDSSLLGSNDARSFTLDSTLPVIQGQAIGDAVFSSSAVTFDYASRRVWLTPSEAVVQPPVAATPAEAASQPPVAATPADAAGQPPVAHHNKTGFDLEYTKGAFATVSYVQDGSPAAEVGLHKGDQVIAINTQMVSGTVIATVKQQIDAEDKDPIQLTVLRDGRVADLDIQPRDDVK